jgi:hypothetical protein
MSDFCESQVTNGGKPCDSLRSWQATAYAGYGLCGVRGTAYAGTQSTHRQMVFKHLSNDLVGFARGNKNPIAKCLRKTTASEAYHLDWMQQEM